MDNSTLGLKDFVEKIDNLKKQNPADLSSDQDLSIAIMNLISIEEHFVFSGAKTGKTKYYDMIEPIREIRKEMLQKIIKEYEGEVWCISKHLLASSMRLMEVGTKQQSLGNKDEATNMFNKAYELYCLFWAVNIKDNDITKNSSLSVLNVAKDAISNITSKIDNTPKIEDKQDASKMSVKDNSSFMDSIKSVVTKALNCCRE